MSKYEAQILVRGRPVRVFTHEGDVFIEGRKGSTFELKFTNNTWDKIEVVISVDGLSVVDGESCGTESEGYLVDARDSIIIPGWKLANNTAAEFIFKNKGKSYANQIGSDSVNIGVIGFMVFTEEVVVKEEPVIAPVLHPYPVPCPYPYPTPIVPRQPWERLYNDQWTFGSNTAGDPREGLTRTICSADKITSSSTSVNESFNGVSASLTNNAVMNVSNIINDGVEPFELGVGWGDEVNHEVETVDFKRESPHKPNRIITLYYDSRKALESRGIDVTGAKKKRPDSELPNAFPTYNNSGCKPPKGWKGKRK